jgi:TolB-like protein
MADVFISYARDDRERIEKLAAALEAEGFSVWWDRRIDAGSEFSKDIERELNAAKAVIVAWSSAGNASSWVRDEASFARDRAKLLPIRLDAEGPPLGFQQFHAFDFSQWRGDQGAEEFATLVASLRRRIAGETAAFEPAPARPKGVLAQLRRRPVVLAGMFAAVALIAISVFVAQPFATRPAGAPQGEAADHARPPPEEASARSAEAVAKGARVGLAVIPFTNLSSDPEQEHFVDGLTEELLNWLGNVEGLRVPGRTSSFQFKGKAEDLRAMGAALDVDYLLEGSVRRSGDALRITAQLIEANGGSHLWSETYDRRLADIFVIQDEIARIVVTELLGKIPETGAANPAAVGDVDPRAHELYLEGRALFSPRRWDEAYEKFAGAIAIDPRHALAQAYIAIIAANTEANGFQLPGSPDLDAVAARALAEAVRLKPQAADVLLAQGWVAEAAATRFVGPAPAAVAALYERAVRANPRHVEALHALARTASGQKAIEIYERVLDIDPAHTSARNNMIKFYVELGDRAQAISLARQGLIMPDSRKSAAAAGRRLGDLGLTGEALFQDFEATERDFVLRFFRASTLVDLGAVGEARFLYQREIDKTKEPSWRQMARINVALLEGRADAGVGAAQAMHEFSPPPPWSAWALSTALIRSGDPQKAYDVLIARRPDIARGTPQIVETEAITEFLDPELLTAAHALHLLGRREEARALWKSMLAAFDSGPPAMSWSERLVLSLLHANLGDRAAAAKTFRAAYDAGFRHLWSYESLDSVLDGFSSEDGLFAALVAIPENAALIERIKAENAATLEAFNRQYGVLDKVRALMAAEAAAGHD